MTTQLPDLDLAKIGIRLGDELKFWNDPEKTCIVTQLYPTEVRYEGKLLSLSRAAKKVNSSDDGGPRHWMFEGQTLRERRTEFREWHKR